MLCVLVFALLLPCAQAMAAKKISNASAESASGAVITEPDDHSFRVTCNAQKDKEYVVMVVSEDGVGEGEVPTKASINNNQNGVVVYMDQATGDSEGHVAFNVRPNLESANGEQYFVYVSSNESAGTPMQRVALFSIEDVLDLIGDVNGDDRVNSSDITALVNLIISGRTLTDNQKLAADSNGDGIVNSSDITALVNLVIRG
jgi:hypothetical protein